ncbi:hypothetical protein Smic_01650 [Streptomyces microflavus]|uniref:Uncharacterized protein n=1 Tax=Streptomyces microflavus TaxID=1919 RepID=A0A7J0CGQ2_STRMI|nr:hypothetical protein Smic_01650 [Streptomyces microflavus]
MEGAEGLHGEPHTGFDGGRVGHVHGYGGRPRAGALQLGGGLAGVLLVVVGDDDGRAGRGEQPGDGEADAGGAAGDEGGAAGELGRGVVGVAGVVVLMRVPLLLCVFCGAVRVPCPPGCPGACPPDTS